MKRDILAVDVGTSAFKLAVFSAGLEQRCEAARPVEAHVYDEGKADIEPEKWWQALRECCAEVKRDLSRVGAISLSVTTPGLTPMAADGKALGPAILFFDGRSHQQARSIRERVGDETFLRETCNLPVAGGSSLCSMLWIRENQPEVWAAAEKFGHTNTYLVKRLTGKWAIDPSTVSITGMYNTAANDLTWNAGVLRAAGIPESKLPPVMHSYAPVGRILPSMAGELGLPLEATVLCGGNDAVLAAFSSGQTEPGAIGNVCGTCEITAVSVDAPVRSPNFNVRCHVVPGRWFTFFVLNAGGIALDWFHSVFCREMPRQRFYDQYIPSVLADFFSSGDLDRREAALPQYVPFLGGSRYAKEPLQASFSGVSLETTREMLLLGLIRGNAAYHGAHLAELAGMVKLGRKVAVTGGGANIPGIMAAKRRWTGDFEYVYQDQCSLRGAAMLACHGKSGGAYACGSDAAASPARL
jgi:sugar (pentulose or hexulose) kinase